MAFIRCPTSFPMHRLRGRVRTPTILQMEAAECGAVSLGIILAYHGLWIPQAELRRECGVSRDGSQASHLLRAAQRYGFEAKAYSITLEDLSEFPCPYIIFWNFNHFLVVEGIGKAKVHLNDPAAGPRTVSAQEFSESYTGVVLCMQPGENFRRSGRKPSALRALYNRLEGSLGTLAYCVLLGFMLVLPGLAIPVFSQMFVDNVLVQGLTDWLRPLVLGLTLTALLRGIFSLWQLKFLRALKIKLSVVTSSRFLWHILLLPVSFYSQRYAGEISSRIAVNDEVAGVLAGRLASTIIDLFMVVFYAIVMVSYDPVLALIGILSATVNLAILKWVSRRRVDANRRLAQAQGKASGVAIAGLQSLETLKASGLESDFFTRWAGFYAKAINAQQELNVANQCLGVLPPFLSALTSVLILTVGGRRVMDGTFSIGMLIAFQSLMQSFLQPVNNLLGLGGTIQELEGDLNRLDDVLVEKTDVHAEKTADLSPAGDGVIRLTGDVELRDVTFGYSRATSPLIKGLNLAVRPGQRIAIVGPSGSGKSTIARLVCGLYEPWKGEILFDGKPRHEIPREVLSTSIAMVEQDVFLFEGSVRDNLTLWYSASTERDLIQAACDASIHDDIGSLPGGYEGELEEGARNLSGGQRQRLEIARALVNNPSLLVLDEATSALDAETERVIDQGLRRRGCSCIIVAHRLSTIRDCDEIIVLEEGRAIERGNHRELLAIGGAYARLLSMEGEALNEGAPPGLE